MRDKDVCPVCGNGDGFCIRASGSEWAGIVATGIGRVF